MAAQQAVVTAPSASRPVVARRDRTFTRWAVVTVGVLFGYLVFGRAFAYIGVPGVPIFIGEVLLAAFFLFKPATSGARWFRALVHRSTLSPLAWSLYALLAYGLLLAARGVLAGYPRRTVLEELAFDLYPLYLLLGLWLAERDPRILERSLFILAWMNGIYGIAYMVLLKDVPATFPGATEVFLFNKPSGQAIALLAILSFRWELRRAWLPLLLNAAVLLGSQTRAYWAGFIVALVVWAILSRRVGRTLLVSGVLALVLTVAWIVDVRFQADRGPGEYSARNVVGAAIAPFDRELAAQYTDYSRNFAGTTEWRRDWWRGIWKAANDDPVVMVVGHGYGFPLATTAVLRSTPPDLRTPHNWFFFALGYGGWLGVGVFVFFLGALGHLLWRTYQRTEQPFGLAVLALAVVVAAFSNFFETPYAAIPVYLVLGMAAVPGVTDRATSVASASAERGG